MHAFDRGIARDRAGAALSLADSFLQIADRVRFAWGDAMSALAQSKR